MFRAGFTLESVGTKSGFSVDFFSFFFNFSAFTVTLQLGLFQENAAQ